MAHHGLEPQGFMNNDWDHFQKDMPASQQDRINASEAMKSFKKIGATGNFPDGKLNSSDEGEIQIGIKQIDGRVVMNFGKPIEWIGFTKEQAVQIAESLIKNSK